MKLKLVRSANVHKPGRAYCIGHLYIDGAFFCDTIEDYDRGLSQDMSVNKIRSVKVDGATAIPSGTYEIAMNVVSPSYSKKDFYKVFCGARMPRLLDVPGWSGVLIHPGNDESSSAGCLIVGENKEVGRVINSRNTWCKLYDVLASAKDKITIEIVRKW